MTTPAPTASVALVLSGAPLVVYAAGDGAVPAFTHDCDACTFLGTYDEADLYHCGQGGRIPTVIARYSSEGPDYASGLYGLDNDGAMCTLRAPRRVARALAAARGLPVRTDRGSWSAS